MNKIVLAALLSSFVAVPAIAADTGYYVGVKLGFNTVGASNSGAFGAVGGYTIGPNFALELGYTNLGSILDSVANDTANFSAVELSAVASFWVIQQYFLFGKLGIANTTVTGLGLTGVNRLAPTYGLGIHYNVMPAVVVRYGWDHYGFGDDLTWVRGNSNLYSVTGLFKF